MRANAIGDLVRILGAAGLLTILPVAGAAQQPASRTPPLPAAVLQAFQQTYPGAMIAASSQGRDANRTVFRVESIDKGRRRVVVYDTRGTAIEVAEQVKEEELPRPVAAAMHSHPRAKYVTGMRVTRGGSVEYRLTLRGTRKTAMVAKPDGTVVSFE
jgi:hypothetical protein